MENYVPAILPTAPRPVHVILYHLPPPPPGCLYAFSTSGRPFLLQTMPPLISIAEPFIPLFQSPNSGVPYSQEQHNTIASSKLSVNPESFEKCISKLDSANPIDPIQQTLTYNRLSIPSAPVYEESNDGSSILVSNNSADSTYLSVAPSSDHVAIVFNPLNAEKQTSITLPAEGQSATQCLSEQLNRQDTADPKPSRFWCMKGTGFSRPQFQAENIAGSSAIYTWGHSTSSSSCQSDKTLDEAVAQNKRFNKTPSFRNKKFVRTSSRNGCLWETGKRVALVSESSGSSFGPAAGMATHCNPHHTSKRGQHRITEYWRPREKPKELDGSSDLTQSSKTEKACNPKQLDGMIKLMHSFSFGLKNDWNAPPGQSAKDSAT